MICRGGMVAGNTSGGFLRSGSLAPDERKPLPPSWRRMAVAVAACGAALALVARGVNLPPLVESDYCYQLMAADRMVAGLGLTCPKPVAPFQPWEWTYDWGFLTNWPVGYSILVAALRKAFQWSTVQACRWISVAACAAAVVGWFVWTRRVAPGRIGGWLIGAAAAGSAVSVSSLINLSTDALLVAALPWVMLLTLQGVEAAASRAESATLRRACIALAVAGLVAGGLFWIRYASVFVPVATGAFLLIAFRTQLRARLPHLACFAVSAAFPVVALIVLNRIHGGGESTSAQLNLGTALGFDFSPSRIARAWWMFTDLGYYDHRPAAHWLFALLPLAVAAGALWRRSAVRPRLAAPPVVLSVCLVATALGMLVAASTVFHEKFDYVGLDRYYAPVRPFYFLIVVGPLLAVRARSVRVLASAGLVLAASWTVQQDWSRTVRRWTSGSRSSTPAGYWSRCFEPGAGELYAWLRGQNDARLVVLSNFSEYIALETGIAALPIPADRAVLEGWLARIRTARGVNELRVLFVMDPDNKRRSYWIPSPATIIGDLGLTRVEDCPVQPYVYEFAASPEHSREAAQCQPSSSPPSFVDSSADGASSPDG